MPIAMKILPLTTDLEPQAIAALAERRLRESPYFFLRNLTCQFDDGTLTLRGCVPLGRLRQFAEAIVSRIEGIRDVDNRVQVVDAVWATSSAPAARTAG